MENSKALEKLNLLVKDEDVWLSSLDLSEITGKLHHNVLRDIRKDIIETLNSNLRNLRTEIKFDFSSQESLSKLLNDTKTYISSLDVDNVYASTINALKIEEYDILTRNGRQTYYLLNRDASFLILSRYSLEVKSLVNHLFFKSVDLMKSKGYIINNVDDMYRATEEEFKMNSDMFLDDLKEDGVLSDFNAFYLLDVLMRKIPEELNDYFCDNFPLYKRIRRQVFEKGDNEYTITHNVKPVLGKNINKK